jgi:molybdopterin biosynthesis enzyme
VPDRHSVDAAIAWVDAATHCLGTEDAPLHTTRRRVLTEPMRALESIPGSDRAALDGFAVQASASFGASAYNPVRLPLIALATGDALPAETDAVVPLELAEPDGQGWIEMVEAVVAGDNVEHQGAIATTGATLVPAGTRLAARHIGLLTSAGLSEVPVVRRPRVRILIASLSPVPGFRRWLTQQLAEEATPMPRCCRSSRATAGGTIQSKANRCAQP